MSLFVDDKVGDEHKVMDQFIGYHIDELRTQREALVSIWSESCVLSKCRTRKRADKSAPPTRRRKSATPSAESSRTRPAAPKKLWNRK